MLNEASSCAELEHRQATAMEANNPTHSTVPSSEVVFPEAVEPMKANKAGTFKTNDGAKPTRHTLFQAGLHKLSTGLGRVFGNRLKKALDKFIEKYSDLLFSFLATKAIGLLGLTGGLLGGFNWGTVEALGAAHYGEWSQHQLMFKNPAYVNQQLLAWPNGLKRTSVRDTVIKVGDKSLQPVYEAGDIVYASPCTLPLHDNKRYLIGYWSPSLNRDVFSVVTKQNASFYRLEKGSLQQALPKAFTINTYLHTCFQEGSVLKASEINKA